MNPIHVTFPSGAKSTYEEDELRVMWDRGRIQEGTLYWVEGMPEWRPLVERFGPPLEQPKPATPRPVSTHGSPAVRSYAKDPRSLTSFLVVMLWVSLALEILSLFSDASQLSLLGREFTIQEAEANDARQTLIGIAYLVVFLTTAVTFLRWVHRANVNCRGFGAEGMTFTPGWSVGYYFIPFINLVRPYQAMKEIWQASHNPSSWKTSDPIGPLGLWWTLWLVNGFLGQLTFRLSARADTIEALKSSTMVAIAASVAGIPLCLVALKMVKEVALQQELQVRGT